MFWRESWVGKGVEARSDNNMHCRMQGNPSWWKFVELEGIDARFEGIYSSVSVVGFRHRDGHVLGSCRGMHLCIQLPYAAKPPPDGYLSGTWCWMVQRVCASFRRSMQGHAPRFHTQPAKLTSSSQRRDSGMPAIWIDGLLRRPPWARGVDYEQWVASTDRGLLYASASSRRSKRG